MSLYVGLLLVAFPTLRLPKDVGSWSDPFILFSMLCSGFLVLRGRDLDLAVFKVHAIGLGLLVTGVALSTLAYSSDDGQSMVQLAKFLFATTVSFFCCTILIRRMGQLTTALGCWVLSATISSCVGFLQLWFGNAVPGFEDGGWARFAGLSDNPNGLGVVAGMAIAPGLSLAARSARAGQIFWLVTVFLCVAGISVSASRTGAVIGAASLIAWCTVHFRMGNREFAILVAGSTLAAAAAAGYVHGQSGGGQTVSERLSTAADPYEDRTLSWRLLQYEDVLREAAQNPLLGKGLAPDDVAFRGVQVHNMFLMLFRAGGILSLLGISILLLDLVRSGFRAYRLSKRPSFQIVVAGLAIGVFALALASLSEPLLYKRMNWMPAALLLTAIALSAQKGQSARPTRRSRKSHGRRHRSPPAVDG